MSRAGTGHTPGPLTMTAEREAALRGPCPPAYYPANVVQEQVDAVWAEVDALRARLAEAPAMLEALRGLCKAVDNLDSEEAGAGRNLFVSSGCLICTDGTTPDKFNTGLCAYHAARATLARAEGRTP